MWKNTAPPKKTWFRIAECLPVLTSIVRALFDYPLALTFQITLKDTQPSADQLNRRMPNPALLLNFHPSSTRNADSRGLLQSVRC